MSNFGKDLIAAMTEAAEHAQGNGAAARVHTIEVPDVRAIREALGLSQQAFASAYRIPLATFKGWEQGRRQPDATASAYLSVIARLPQQARDVVAAGPVLGEPFVAEVDEAQARRGAAVLAGFSHGGKKP